ncbi:uncharacterized protein LAESUDRAFT_754616 [Laetiporus sulphureus 93-53]|uniref:Uncharacterized protein n=1 Tax=Laetiporus sulphureus 93-53 TaxID=1314785 RepID=A0A165HS26_9APHY|nr:uncharacterized protein LAESUDRAFT_754616 [Laetiporus sulphureus 93-53]KZT12109.1 hypothetical protein LAESUDRAFT_754616 [Laetiporus sulphureus 93-53]
MSQYNLGGVAFPGGHTASEPSDPWRSHATSTSSEAGSAAPVEEPHDSSTPKASGVVRNPSPTTLPEFTTPQTWEWQGIPYATIEEAADAATPNTIPRDVKEWTMNVMDERHECTVASLEEEILAHIHVKIIAVKTRDQLKVARAKISTLSADNERLIKSNNSLIAEAQAIRKDFEDYKNEVKGQMDALYGNMVTLKEAQEMTTTYIVGLESRLNNTIINAPPQGRKSSENFETWFTNLLIWLNYNHFTNDKDKIRQANAHLEGGAALYMKEYAIKLTSGQDIGTWAEYTRKLEMAYKMLDSKCTAQSLLDAHCTIHHKTMITFAENFRAYAPESGYSDEDLIVKIREQWSAHIQMVMSVMETLDPSKIPTTWMDYLEFCLEIEIKHLQQISSNKSTGQTATTKQGQGKGKGKAMNVRQVEEESSAESSAQIVALEQAIAALRGMSTTSTTPPSSKGKAKAHGADTESTILASTVKDTNARIVELDEFSEDFQYEV